jgi:hypothetical protein
MKRYATHSDGPPRRGPHHPNAKRGPLGCDRITRHSGNCRKDGPICAKRARATFRSTAQRVLKPSVPDRLVPRTVRPDPDSADASERTCVSPPRFARPPQRETGGQNVAAPPRRTKPGGRRGGPAGRGRPRAKTRPCRECLGAQSPPNPLPQERWRARTERLWRLMKNTPPSRALETSGGTQQRQLPRCASAPKDRARTPRLRRSASVDLTHHGLPRHVPVVVSTGRSPSCLLTPDRRPPSPPDPLTYQLRQFAVACVTVLPSMIPVSTFFLVHAVPFGTTRFTCLASRCALCRQTARPLPRTPSPSTSPPARSCSRMVLCF